MATTFVIVGVVPGAFAAWSLWSLDRPPEASAFERYAVEAVARRPETNDGEGGGARLSVDDWIQIANLEAQEGIWATGRNVARVALGSAVVGALGLLFIGWTLRLPQGQLAEARNVTRAQRAFVLIDGAGTDRPAHRAHACGRDLGAALRRHSSSRHGRGEWDGLRRHRRIVHDELTSDS